MHKSIINLQEIKKEIHLKNNNKNQKINIIAVSKTFGIENITPLIDSGHMHFGENKVQEAINKWTEIKKKSQGVKLHMIGKLQTNKVKNVIPLFDYIHSLDNSKLANKISEEQKKQKKRLKIFIQINIGNEPQKSGIEIKNLKNFYSDCTLNLDLDIIGLMCIPPQSGKVKTYFEKMYELNNSLGLQELSMGMSSDFIEAAECGSSYLRIGSKIFGNRN